MKIDDVQNLRRTAADFLRNAHITITPEEENNIEIADFGLNDIKNIGLQIIVYENNERYCAKDLILFPHQICPEHQHPPQENKNIGKQETFRCRWGEVYLYVEGKATENPKAKIPENYRSYFNVWKEINLKPGDQYTLAPNTLHWFQAGDQGAIVSEFSSTSDDASDIFTDPRIKRVPEISE